MLFLTTAAQASLVVLPNAVPYEYFGLNFAENIGTSTASLNVSKIVLDIRAAAP